MKSAKSQAHQAVKKALKSGLLVCPEKCSCCGAGVPLQAHHADYSQPLVVEWLCTGCHVQRHQELGDRPIREPGSKHAKRPAPFSIRVESAALEAYRGAAARAGMSTAEWARHVLNVASGAARIRYVYFIDVGSMEPEEAIKHIKDVGKKVRTGKW